MKILNTYQKLTIATFNVSSQDDDLQLARLNFTWKLFSAIFSVFAGFCAASVFFICADTTFQEYSETFFPWGAVLTAFLGAIFQIFYSGARTFRFIDSIQRVLEKRMYSNKNNNNSIAVWHSFFWLANCENSLPLLSQNSI